MQASKFKSEHEDGSVNHPVREKEREIAVNCVWAREEGAREKWVLQFATA